MVVRFPTSHSAPDGSRVATASSGAHLFESATGKSLDQWGSKTTYVAVSRDANRIATDSALVDIDNRQIALKLTDSTLRAFSPDGRYLAATTKDGTVWLQPFFPNTQALIDAANSLRAHINNGTICPRPAWRP